jgi:hypothetical protein
MKLKCIFGIHPHWITIEKRRTHYLCECMYCNKQFKQSKYAIEVKLYKK